MIEFSQPTGPELVTDIDIALAQRQCELQHATSPEQIQGMTTAFTEAKKVALSDEVLDAETVEILVVWFGRLVEPKKAAKWRTTPVTFASGDKGESPENIPRAIAGWAEAVAENRLDPTEAYYYFEKIHPYADGNGRVGHCVWALLQTRTTGAWPQTLPPDVFGEGYESPPQSAFGDIEL